MSARLRHYLAAGAVALVLSAGLLVLNAPDASAGEPEPEPPCELPYIECADLEPQGLTAVVWCGVFTLGLLSGTALFGGRRG